MTIGLCSYCELWHHTCQQPGKNCRALAEQQETVRQLAMQNTPAGEAENDLLANLRDGAWLDAQTFPPLRYAVPGLIPEGFTLLIGPPKAGKSWLALAVLLALATGGRALGRIRVGKSRVLYLALEDGDRRMQDRCRALMLNEPLPVQFCYLTRVNPGEVLLTIAAFLERYPDTTLVILDTLGKVLPPTAPTETQYQRDYRIGGTIKAIADSMPGLAVVVLHHDRKAGAEDFVDRVSGTNGLAGAADTILVLSRARQSEDGTLAVTGRDIIESEYALTLSGGTWALDGNDLADAARKARERDATAGLGDVSTAVIAYVNAHPDGATPSEVGAAVGLDPKTAGVYLGRAYSAGRVDRPRRGLYTPVVSVGLLNPDALPIQQPTLSTGVIGPDPSTGGR